MLTFPLYCTWNVFLHRSVLVEQGYLRTWFRWARGIESSLHYFLTQ